MAIERLRIRDSKVVSSTKNISRKPQVLEEGNKHEKTENGMLAAIACSTITSNVARSSGRSVEACVRCESKRRGRPEKHSSPKCRRKSPRPTQGKRLVNREPSNT